MIAYLKGKILKKSEKGLILDVGNVGYFIHLPKDMLAEAENEIELYIHSHIKEDAHDLYGFSSDEDHTFFTKLISVKGIGPKVALEIMNLPTEKVSGAIINEDVALICSIPGIGKKTAQRLILELKDKVTSDLPYNTASNSAHAEAIDALVNLGYQRKHISLSLQNLPKEIEKTEEIIKYFLKNA